MHLPDAAKIQFLRPKRDRISIIGHYQNASDSSYLLYPDTLRTHGLVLDPNGEFCPTFQLYLTERGHPNLVGFTYI
jgi:hypothetical protein